MAQGAFCSLWYLTGRVEAEEHRVGRELCCHICAFKAFFLFHVSILRISTICRTLWLDVLAKLSPGSINE